MKVWILCRTATEARRVLLTEAERKSLRVPGLLSLHTHSDSSIRFCLVHSATILIAILTEHATNSHRSTRSACFTQHYKQWLSWLNMQPKQNLP